MSQRRCVLCSLATVLLSAPDGGTIPPAHTCTLMTEKIIQFENAREAAELTGHQAEILCSVEKALEVQLVSRDTWMRLEGDSDKVDVADRFFQCLRKARNRGAYKPEHSITFTLQAFRDGRGHDVEAMYDTGIMVGRGRSPIFPRTFGQNAYLHLMMKNDIVFGIGPAGTGKTYLAMAMAVHYLMEEKVKRIILTRPAIEAGEALGFLPGGVEQKVFPYLRPLYDALYDMMDTELMQKFMDQGIIEIAPLAYMRGRTLNNAFVILDEAQNTTPEQMFMFLTRLGFSSKSVITGDLTQIDLPRKKSSGLIEAKTALRNIPSIGISELSDMDVVRHPLVQNIIRSYRACRSQENTTEEEPK